MEPAKLKEIATHVTKVVSGFDKDGMVSIDSFSEVLKLVEMDKAGYEKILKAYKERAKGMCFDLKTDTFIQFLEKKISEAKN